MPREYKGPLFQHRHYAEIAKVLSKARGTDVLFALGDLFTADNPRFDRQRFNEAAAGMPSNKKDVRK